MARTLEEQSQAAAKITYLSEGLAVVENDREAGAIQLRSDAPYVGENIYFFEMILREGAISLERRRRSRKNPTLDEVSPTSLSRDLFARLVNDLCAIARIRAPAACALMLYPEGGMVPDPPREPPAIDGRIEIVSPDRISVLRFCLSRMLSSLTKTLMKRRT